jgi:hypothetical protein
MDTKLTLSMEKKIIEGAKNYAKKRKVSLSKMIENYLISVMQNGSREGEEITPLVDSLSGVLDLRGGHKRIYADHLAKKYK